MVGLEPFNSEVAVQLQARIIPHARLTPSQEMAKVPRLGQVCPAGHPGSPTNEHGKAKAAQASHSPGRRRSPRGRTASRPTRGSRRLAGQSCHWHGRHGRHGDLGLTLLETERSKAGNVWPGKQSVQGACLLSRSKPGFGRPALINSNLSRASCPGPVTR